MWILMHIVHHIGRRAHDVDQPSHAEQERHNFRKRGKDRATSQCVRFHTDLTSHLNKGVLTITAIKDVDLVMVDVR
jgi:hypothetical protein